MRKIYLVLIAVVIVISFTTSIVYAYCTRSSPGARCSTTRITYSDGRIVWCKECCCYSQFSKEWMCETKCK